VHEPPRTATMTTENNNSDDNRRERRWQSVDSGSVDSGSLNGGDYRIEETVQIVWSDRIIYRRSSAAHEPQGFGRNATVELATHARVPPFQTRTSTHAFDGGYQRSIAGRHTKQHQQPTDLHDRQHVPVDERRVSRNDSPGKTNRSDGRRRHVTVRVDMS